MVVLILCASRCWPAVRWWVRCWPWAGRPRTPSCRGRCSTRPWSSGWFLHPPDRRAVGAPGWRCLTCPTWFCSTLRRSCCVCAAPLSSLDQLSENGDNINHNFRLNAIFWKRWRHLPVRQSALPLPSFGFALAFYHHHTPRLNSRVLGRFS